MPEGRSALQGGRKPGRFGAPVADGPWVTAREVRGLTIVEVAGWPDTFPGVVAALPAAIGCPVSDHFGVSSASGDTAVFWTGPRRLWVVTPDGAVGERLERAFDDDRAVSVDLTQSRTILRIAGPKSRALLAKGLPIDLHPREFPAGGVALGAIHHMGVAVHLRDTADGTTFDLYVGRSHALSLWEWLAESAAEFGYEVLD